MKIYSVESGRKIRKGITVRKKENFIEVISFDKKTDKVFLSVVYPDFVFSKVVLPSVEDRETLIFLLENRLSALLEKGKNYSFALFEKEKISENEISYDVYAIPEKVFFDSAQKSSLPIKDIDFFTVDVFSLITFSCREMPQKTVFHFYGDEEKILMMVSKDNYPIYVRTVPLPDSIEENKISNIYYENFNMTYMFVYQNKRIEIEEVLISGKASFVKEFISLVKNLTDKDVSKPKKENYISGISEEDFHDYLIPIGTVFLDDKFNFIPFSIKKEKAFNSILNLLTFIVVGVSLLLSIVSVNLFFKLSQENIEIEKFSIQVTEKAKEIEQLISNEEIGFYSKVFKNIEESRKSNPLIFFYDLRDIFYLLEEKSIQFSNKNQEVIVVSEKSFDSVSDMIIFRNRLNELIKKKNMFQINLNVQEDQQNLKLTVTLRILRNESGF